MSYWDQLKPDDTINSIEFEAIIPETSSVNKEVKVTLITGGFLENKQSAKVHFRIADMTAGKFIEQPMLWNGTNYSATIPVKYLNPNYDLLIYFTSISKEGNVIMHPGILHDKYLTPYYVVKMVNN